ncbi:MAG: hypothetical protein ACO1N1_22990 [Dyadobacter fermentans]
MTTGPMVGHLPTTHSNPTLLTSSINCFSEYNRIEHNPKDTNPCKMIRI